jgi:hypothetical protein
MPAGCGVRQEPRRSNEKGDLVGDVTYEIRVMGSLGPAAREAFTDLSVEVEPTTTVLSGDLDQTALHAVLDRVRALGLELIDVKQAPAPLDLGEAADAVAD